MGGRGAGAMGVAGERGEEGREGRGGRASEPAPKKSSSIPRTESYSALVGNSSLGASML